MTSRREAIVGQARLLALYLRAIDTVIESRSSKDEYRFPREQIFRYFTATLPETLTVIDMPFSTALTTSGLWLESRLHADLNLSILETAVKWIELVKKNKCIAAVFSKVDTEGARQQGFYIQPVVDGLDSLEKMLSSAEEAVKHFCTAQDIRDAAIAPFRWMYDFADPSHPASVLALAVMTECIPQLEAAFEAPLIENMTNTWEIILRPMPLPGYITRHKEWQEVPPQPWLDAVEGDSCDFGPISCYPSVLAAPHVADSPELVAGIMGNTLSIPSLNSMQVAWMKRHRSDRLRAWSTEAPPRDMARSTQEKIACVKQVCPEFDMGLLAARLNSVIEYPEHPLRAIVRDILRRESYTDLYLGAEREIPGLKRVGDKAEIQLIYLSAKTLYRLWFVTSTFDAANPSFPSAP